MSSSPETLALLFIHFGYQAMRCSKDKRSTLYEWKIFLEITLRQNAAAIPQITDLRPVVVQISSINSECPPMTLKPHPAPLMRKGNSFEGVRLRLFGCNVAVKQLGP
ncbi:hypothetical protein BC936DRAFT_145187 [Jimgerdemannia flammicorona]|uniref:Uncharacterized protein n=1 Tax=Jimgerdemannia flammicorona TaxID=994334 RepID=A0A433DLY5_9FUNG|nr:hypothetical protein BC936DRAFT_145187 [Jimgerdemannia flammicorona]